MKFFIFYNFFTIFKIKYTSFSTRNFIYNLNIEKYFYITIFTVFFRKLLIMQLNIFYVFTKNIKIIRNTMLKYDVNFLKQNYCII